MMFALTLGTRPSPDEILMLLDERSEADQIAAELQRHGQVVRIVEVERRTDWVRPQPSSAGGARPKP